jgi:hypothetical protein
MNCRVRVAINETLATHYTKLSPIGFRSCETHVAVMLHIANPGGHKNPIVVRRRGSYYKTNESSRGRADPHPASSVRWIIVIAACSSGLPAF